MDLKEYFTDHWPLISDFEQYTYTGYNLLDVVKPNERVLDVGCGVNPFKPFLKQRVWGIDITDIGSDEQISIEDYTTDDKFDVAFVLGSINFGNRELIHKQIKSVDESLKSNGRIYWRCNPGKRDHKTEHVDKVDFFPWTLKEHVDFADEFGYNITEFMMDGIEKNRMYVKWESKVK